MNNYISIFEELANLIGESGDTLDSLSGVLTAISGLTSLGVFGFIAIVSIVTAVLSVIVSIVVWILESIPVFSLAKKVGLSNAWLAWVPIFGSEFRLYVLSNIAGNKPFTVYKEKYTIKDRKNSFWLYVAIKYLGAAVISAVVGVASTIIPIIGSFSSVLMLLPGVACFIAEYVYLRDVLDVFKPNKDANKKASFFVTLLDTFVTFGFARIVYLFTIIKCSPLPQTDEIVIEQPATK